MSGRLEFTDAGYCYPKAVSSDRHYANSGIAVASNSLSTDYQILLQEPGRKVHVRVDKRYVASILKVVSVAHKHY